MVILKHHMRRYLRQQKPCSESSCSRDLFSGKRPQGESGAVIVWCQSSQDAVRQPKVTRPPWKAPAPNGYPFLIGHRCPLMYCQRYSCLLGLGLFAGAPAHKANQRSPRLTPAIAPAHHHHLNPLLHQGQRLGIKELGTGWPSTRLVNAPRQPEPAGTGPLRYGSSAQVFL